jgi:hypothetical protein
MKSIVLISLPFAFLLPFGCGPSETDSTDEAGAVPDHDTRVELIFVDADTASAQEADTDTIVEALPIDTLPIETPPAPTAADETGGDDLLSFDAEGKFTVQVGTFKNSAVASHRVGWDIPPTPSVTQRGNRSVFELVTSAARPRRTALASDSAATTVVHTGWTGEAPRRSPRGESTELRNL